MGVSAPRTTAPLAPVAQRIFDGKPSIFFFFLMIRPPPSFTLFPYTTLFRSRRRAPRPELRGWDLLRRRALRRALHRHDEDRKSTRLNSSHGSISYAVFCL